MQLLAVLPHISDILGLNHELETNHPEIFYDLLSLQTNIRVICSYKPQLLPSMPSKFIITQINLLLNSAYAVDKTLLNKIINNNKFSSHNTLLSGHDTIDIRGINEVVNKVEREILLPT
jgi:hypothetical protein